jgi:glycine cleavage system aminomethyltransferase T/glycine/D-amino acid oxidase-like deaminating enzyme
MTGRVVVIGSGIVGSSVAYHLARLGWTDVLIVDQGDPVENPGSTSHAPGGVVALSHNKTLTQLAVYSSRLYATLEPFSPDRRMVNQLGILDVAISGRRMADLVRLHGESISFETGAKLLTPAETAEIHPLINPEAMVGSIFMTEGQTVAPAHISGAMQRDAGVKVLGHAEVTDLDIDGGRVRAVITNHPDHTRIECDHAVIATNIWAPLLGERLGVPIPLMGYEHQYLRTGPLPELERFDPSQPDEEIVYPSVRELDTYIYFRQHWNSFGVGSYRHAPRPVPAGSVGPNAIHPFTPADFEGEAWEKARRIFPLLAKTDFRTYPRMINGIFAFPVDGMPIVGPAPIEGVWVAAGSWLTHAGGVGKTLAEWMTAGDTEWDVRQLDVNRFHDFQTTKRFIEKVCDKNYAEIYDIIHPKEPITEPRDVRLSAFHNRHLTNKAVFTTFAGLELPNWFESNASLVETYADSIPERHGWAAEHWSPVQGAEHLATRDRVGLFDLTGLSIIEVSGREALEAVQWLCSNQMDVGPGRVVYTTWLTPNGGVRRDLAVVRLGTDRFWMFVGEGTRPRDLDWARRQIRSYDVAINDLSDSYTALGLWGPKARQVLQRVSHSDLDFGYFRARWIDLGYTRALAVRISYAGELGWELHFPPESALGVWDLLWEAGADLGLAPAGFGAFDSLRLEKGYRGWGTDVYTEYNAYEAGLGWTVRLDKGDFLGADACRRLVTEPLKKKLACLTLDEPDDVVMGYEPIMSGDQCLGHVTSANFGYSVGKSIAYGYLPTEAAVEGTKVEVIYFGERLSATVAPDPLFDPKMTRMKD